MASASDGETPFAAAIEPTWDGLTVSAVGWAPLLVGVEVETRTAVAAGAACAGAPEKLSVVPEMRKRAGSRPLAAARADTERPWAAAIPDRVSPGATT